MKIIKTITLAMFAFSFLFASTGYAFAAQATVKITSPVSGFSAEIGKAQIVRWTTSNYPKDAGVDITLLQKTSSNPNKFKLVKVIKENTPNDGMEEWVPAADEAGDNLVLQVGCAKNYIFPEGCSSLESASQISSSVPQERTSYLAGSLSAIKDILGRLSSFLKSFLLRN